MQEHESADVARRQKEFATIVLVQQALGITIHGSWENYWNQESQLQRSCNQCKICESPNVIAAKAKSGQVCKKLGRLKSAATRRQKPEVIEARVTRLGCAILDGLQNYANNKSLLTVRHTETGIVVTRPADDFREGGRLDRLLNAFLNGDEVGETITCAVSHFLLSCQAPLVEVIEVSPPYLRSASKNPKVPMRHDVYFADVLGLKVAIEHQGKYHSDPEDPIYRRSKKTFGDVVARDKLVREECARNNVFLVEIEDLVVFSKDLVDAGNRVCSALIKIVPRLLELPGISERQALLQNPEFILDLCIKAGLASSNIPRLRAQLEAETLPIEIRSYDPVSGYFDLICTDPHHPPHAWKGHANNVLGSEKTGRAGTRCPECAKRLRGARRRLSFAEVVAEGIIYGARPKFEAGEYRRNSQYLQWQWLDCGHSYHETLAHIQEGRSCRVCRALADDISRREKEHAVILALANARGDTLLSPVADYQKQTSKMRLSCTRADGCGKDFEQTAAKIKAGQLHDCDKHHRAWRTRHSK